jgi:MFS family permease
VSRARLAPNLAVLAASVFVIGFCAAVFGLARHSFMTTRVPLTFRARALSLLGGTFRLGMFVGPFIAAALLAVFGDEHATVWFFGVCLVATVLLVLLGPDPEADGAAPGGPRAGRLARRRGHRRAGHRIDPHARARGRLPHDVALPRRAVAAGLAAASLSAVRSARQVVLPLWGVSIGLDAQTIALVVGISGAIDFALFYASGQVMDRFGRLWAALPR